MESNQMTEKTRELVEGAYYNWEITDWEKDVLRNMLRYNSISAKQAEIINRIYLYGTRKIKE